MGFNVMFNKKLRETSTLVLDDLFDRDTALSCRKETPIRTRSALEESMIRRECKPHRSIPCFKRSVACGTMVRSARRLRIDVMK